MLIQLKSHHQAAIQISPVQIFLMTQVTQLKKIENEKNKVTAWKSTLLIKNKLLEIVNGKSKTVKAIIKKNAVMEELA